MTGTRCLEIGNVTKAPPKHMEAKLKIKWNLTIFDVNYHNSLRVIQIYIITTWYIGDGKNTQHVK